MFLTRWLLRYSYTPRMNRKSESTGLERRVSPYSGMQKMAPTATNSGGPHSFINHNYLPASYVAYTKPSLFILIASYSLTSSTTS